MESDQETKKIIQNYNCWSNFMYFISGAYACLVPIILKETGVCISKPYVGVFVLFGILLIITGSVSCAYHHHTPSFNGNVEKVKTKEFISLQEMDQYLALTSLIYGILFVLVRIMDKKFMVLVKDPTLYLTILMGIIAIIFYSIASNHNHEAIHNCKKNDKTCIDNNLDAYDIFHSNWHLFTGIGALFGITLLKHTFDIKE